MKKMIIRIAGFCLGAMLPAIVLQGQELSLDDALTRGKQASPRLQSLEAAVKAREAAAEQAKVALNPMLGVTAGNREQMLEIMQDLEHAGKRLARTNAALAERETASQAWKITALEMEREIAGLFYEILWVERNSEMLRENLNVSERSLESAAYKFERGVGGKLDVIKGKVEVARAKRMLESADQELLAVLARLRIRLKIKPGQPLILKGDLQTRPEYSSGLPRETSSGLAVDRLVAFALRSHPALALEQSKRRAAEYKVEMARLSAKPDFSLGLSGGLDDNEAKIGVTFSLPLAIWDKKKGAVDEALFANKGAEFDVETAAAAISENVMAAFHAYLAADQSARLFEGALLGEAKGAAELARKAYDEGSFRFLDLIDAQRTYLETHLEYLAGLRALRQAEIDLQIDLGKSIQGVSK